MRRIKRVCGHCLRSSITKGPPMRPIDYFFAAALGIALGLLIAAFI